jgi:hypothetical protein
MPVSYRVDRRLGVFFLNCEGCLAADELLKFADIRRSAAPRVFDTIVDLSAVTGTDLSGSDVEGLARSPMDRSRIAIVAPRPALFGLGRMFQIKAELAEQESEIRLFAAAEEAVLWLTGQHSVTAA